MAKHTAITKSQMREKMRTRKLTDYIKPDKKKEDQQ